MIPRVFLVRRGWANKCRGLLPTRCEADLIVGVVLRRSHHSRYVQGPLG